MTVDLDKEDLISLVKGITPPYSLFEHPLVKECGSYTGGFVDRWTWHHYKLKELNEQTLYNLYQLLKNNKS